MQHVYLDNHATTPVDPRVFEAMRPFFTEVFGNAASAQHSYGAAAHAAVEKAREELAALIGSRPKEIIFTSGATESDNLAIKGAAAATPSRRHIVSSPIEHHAVLDCLEHLGRTGYTVDLVPVDEAGVIDLDALGRLVRPDTLLVSIMAANNEIGTVAPLREIAQIAHGVGALVHSDAAQFVGKVPLRVDEVAVDLVSISGHKMYGPKGIGALYVRRGARIAAIMDGGGHEFGLRSGTLNVPGCVGLGVAASIAALDMTQEGVRIVRLRELLLERLSALIPDIEVNGHLGMRLPGNLNIRIPGVDADSLMLACPEVALSSGSACTSASPEPSHVLRAIGLSYEHASQCVRFGIGRFTTEAELEFASEVIASAATRLRDISPGRA